jgi:DNA polymerase I-like protein with 3'-5' exonuclease and polymerase domains
MIDLTRYDTIALDLETTGLKFWSDKIFGAAISTADGDHYFDIRKRPEVMGWLRDQLPRVRTVAFHNAKFDLHFLANHNIGLRWDQVVCTMVRAALIDEHLPDYGLDFVAKKFVGIGKDGDIWQELADMFGGKATKNAQIENLPRAPEALAGRYAKADTRATLKLHHYLEQQIAAQDLGRVDTVERRLLAALVRMERGGVRVDVDGARRAQKDVDALAKRLQKELNDIAGFEVNPNPSRSIHTLFKPQEKDAPDGSGTYWELVDGTIADKTEAGGPSIDADCLRRMKHPAAARILELRKSIKVRDVFLANHILGHHDNGVVHANFNQTKSDNGAGTGTGRLSCNAPALQQIPARDKQIAKIVRSLFLPDHGHEWVANDWAQMDFRVFAHYVKDPEILAAYAADPNTDFHSSTAQMTGLPRSPRFAGDPNAKQINLGLVFGMGKGKLAQEMGLPYTLEAGSDGRVWARPGPEAEAVFAKYHAAIPGVQDLLRTASSVAKARGFVMTALGRRIRFPRGQFTHKAGGLIFQGTAADALKVKICELDDYFESIKGSGARLVLNVHDEFDTSVPPGRADIREEVNRIVTGFGPGDAVHLRVPVVTDQGRGPNWYVASA